MLFRQVRSSPPRMLLETDRDEVLRSFPSRLLQS